MTQRETLENLIADLDAKAAEFEQKMETAETVFAEQMRRGRREFTENMEKTREELRQALRDLG